MEGVKFYLKVLLSFWHLQPNQTCLIMSAVYLKDYSLRCFVCFRSHIVITYQWVCSFPFFTSCWSVFPVRPSFLTEHETPASFQTALELSLLLQTVNDHSLKTCHWLLLEVHSNISVWSEVSRRRRVPEKPGGAVWANADETAAPLSLWEAVMRPLLSHTLAGFHPAISYLSF